MEDLSLTANLKYKDHNYGSLSIFAALSYKLHTATKRRQHT